MRPPSPTPEQSIEQALAARDRGDLLAAARHLGRALLADPHRREWLALLSELMDIVEDPLELIPIRAEGLRVGEIAVRAYALFRRRLYHDAIDHLLQAALAAPHSPLLDWGLAWLKKPETATSINTLRLTRRFQAILNDLPRLHTLPDGGAPLLVRIPPLVRRLRQTQVCDAAFLFTVVELLRHISDLPGAYEAASELHELEPGYDSCLALAAVFRDRGDWERAARWFQEAFDHRPEDRSARLRLADMLWEQGQTAEAEHWYRAALAVDPQDPWAAPSLLAVRYERTGDEAQRDRLDHYAREHPDNHRARDLLDQTGPYFGTWLPEPGEASLGIVRMMVEKWEAGEDILIEGMSLTSLEAPSVYLAYDLQLRREGKRGKLKIDVASIPRPDPRRPRVPVHYQVWRYRGTEPLPNLTEPPNRATEAIVRIASQPYHLKTWLDAAGQVAPSQFGPSRALEALAVMVHPPAVPRGVTPWEWVQRVQIAAAMVLAKLERPWRNSTRRQALFDLINGPSDWTSVAAILALSMLCDVEPEIAPDVSRLFGEILRDAPQTGHVCYLHPLAYAYARLPGVPLHVRRELAQLRRDLEQP